MDRARAATVADEPLAELAVRRAVASRVRNAEQDVGRLLEVGLALMAEADDRDVPRVADIVRAAGLSNDAFYRYFASKDDLVAAIVDDGSRRLLAHVRHQLGKSDDPVVRLRHALIAVLKQATDPEVAATTRAVLRHASASHPMKSTRWTRLATELAVLLREPIAELGVGDPRRDARTVAITVLAAMEHFLWAQGQPSSLDIEHLTDFVLRGLGAPGKLAADPATPSGSSDHRTGGTLAAPIR
jgi:AcrR family transcriptional regulator